MKKLSSKQLWWMKRQSNKARISYKKRSCKRNKNYNSYPKLDVTRNLIAKGVLQAEVNKGVVEITMPNHFNFRSDYDKSIAPILALRDVTSKHENGLPKAKLRSIDFDPITDMSTPASLVLAAEIDVWNRTINGNVRAKSNGWNPEIRRRFCELGFFELLGIKKPQSSIEEPTSGDVQIVKYLVGGPHDVNLARDLRLKIEEIVGLTVKKHELFQGLSEAITNVTHHAYPDHTKDKLWWMTASFDNLSNRLKVVFYDRGISIPGSLPHSSLWERARGFLSKHELFVTEDAHLIKAAMEMGRSETGLSNRGKGLQDLLEFIKSHGKGYLSILSRKGLYKYTLDEGRSSTGVETLKYEMPGTLIIWSVCLG